MIKMKSVIIVSITVLLITFSNEELIAQEIKYKPSILEVKGYVNHGEEEIEKALVLLYQNNKMVKKVYTKKNAKFQFILFRDLKYTIEVIKDGFITEEIVIYTKTTNDHGTSKYIYEFSIDLMKVEEFDGLGLASFDFPSAKINFSVEDNAYTYDTYYSKWVKSKIEKLKKMSISLTKKEN